VEEDDALKAHVSANGEGSPREKGLKSENLLRAKGKKRGVKTPSGD